jgi:hypothetical protein
MSTGNFGWLSGQLSAVSFSNQVFFLLKLTAGSSPETRRDTEFLARGIRRFGRYASCLALSSGLLRHFVQFLLLL